MRLLYDENLSPKLVDRLEDLFPNSLHVRNIGLATASDTEIWNYAAKHQLVVVSKDEDFHHLSFLRGAPPKVIGIQTGNCSTHRLDQLLRDRHDQIVAFGSDPAAAFLPLF